MSLVQPMAQDIVIVGATGDLARRKLLPALYNLFQAGLLPDSGSLIGFARTEGDDGTFKSFARESIEANSRSGLEPDVWEEFSKLLSYIPTGAHGGYRQLLERCRQPSRTFYLAIPSEAVPDVVTSIGENGLAKDGRIVVEKPFGTDLASARKLNALLHQVFDESQIFRIDHYLGKETVQNLLVFRFENSVFEHVWTREMIDHIQITVAESIGVEGRGAFYEQTGALRDIVQNHLLQMLALLTMEPPASFDAEDIRGEKAKLLRSVRPADPVETVRGQYTAGVVDGVGVPGYREEEGVAHDSSVETFIALRIHVENWRWAGIPIYLRTGKRLPSRATELEIAFKQAPIAYIAGSGSSPPYANRLTHRIQPEEKITFQFLAKVPGPSIQAKQVTMNFAYDESFMVQPEEAYERLIHDVLHGDQSLFVREDAVEQAWRIVQPIIDGPTSVRFYPAGTWGPDEARRLVAPEQWRLG